jgi:RNA polymerase sigma-70 factor, ECF subfamily
MFETDSAEKSPADAIPMRLRGRDRGRSGDRGFLRNRKRRKQKVIRRRVVNGRLFKELPASEPSDDAIVARVLNDDMDAFEILTRRYNRYVSRIVTSRVPRGQAAEIVQEAFIQAYRSLEHYRLNTSFRNWLAKITARCCCHFWRARKRQSTTCVVSNLNAEDIEKLEQTCEDTSCAAFYLELEQEKQRDILLKAMERLKDSDRNILRLLYLDNCSLSETAAILGCSFGNIRVRACRARKVLFQLMHCAANPAGDHISLETASATA